jgi:hypothetical protein
VFEYSQAMNVFVKLAFAALVSFASVVSASAQTCLKWSDPAEYGQPCIQLGGYVPGQAICIYTDASELHVRYRSVETSEGSLFGSLDAGLVYIDCDGGWHDLSADPCHADSSGLVFLGLDTRLQHEYRLFLPWHRSPVRLEFGVPSEASFKVASPRLEKPIVVYGSSSRRCGKLSPLGDSILKVLSRRLDWPVLDFGFDCFENTESLLDAVSGMDVAMVIVREDSQDSFQVLEQFRSDGLGRVRNVSFDAEYAGLEAVVREILLMPDCGEGTCHAVTQRRMPGTYDWQETHTEILRKNASDPPRSAFLGDSIIHYWGGTCFANGRESWNSEFASRSFVNLGMAWDNIQNILWRVNHGELDGYKAEEVIVEAGCNNIDDCTDEEIVEGVVFLLEAVRLHQPEARIMYMAILPCSPDEERIRVLDRKLRKVVRAAGFEYSNPGPVLLGKDGRIDRSLFVDDAHPNEKGYRILVERFKRNW